LPGCLFESLQEHPELKVTSCLSQLALPYRCESLKGLLSQETIQIAVRVHLDGRGNLPGTARDGGFPQGAKEVQRKEFWQQIRQITEVLSKTEREVFMLRFFDQLSIKEIGTTLKKNESTVKTHLYRALDKVKEAASGLDGVMEALL
jgi:RNA polymerase sigma factor (sigma-70 family)